MAEYKTDAQVNYGWGLSLNMTGKAPAVTKIIWRTLADLQAYVDDTNDSAIAGLHLSVIEDTDTTKNGIYFVSSIGNGTNSGVVKQIGALNETEITDLKVRLTASENAITSLQANKQNKLTTGNGLALINDKMDLTIDPISNNALKNTTAGLKVIIPDVNIPNYVVAKLTTPSAGAAASYQLEKDGVGVGAVIDIPKDMVVSSGDVKTVTTADVPYTGAKIGDKYIDLVLANAQSSHIYIPVNDLVDNYKGSTYISISADNIISINYTPLKNQLQTDLSTTFDINGINTKLSTLETTVGNSTSGLVKELADANNKINTNTNDISTLKTDVSALKTDVSALKVTVGNSTSGLVKGLADMGTRVDTNTTSINTLSTIVATKLDNNAKVNNKSFAINGSDVFPSILLDGTDISVKANVGPNTAGTSIEGVLNNLNSRIESAVSGGLTSVMGGNGISVSPILNNSQTISLKLNPNTPIDIVTLSTDGLEIKDMRSYWKTL